MYSEIIRIIIICIVGGFLSVLIRNVLPEYSFFIPLIVLCIVINALAPFILKIIDTFNNIFMFSGINKEFFEIILKCIFVAYIASFASSVCLDSNERAISEKINLFGKIMIVYLSLPILNSIISLAKRLIDF